MSDLWITIDQMPEVFFISAVVVAAWLLARLTQLR